MHPSAVDRRRPEKGLEAHAVQTGVIQAKTRAIPSTAGH